MNKPLNLAEHIGKHLLYKIECVLNNADLVSFHCFTQMMDEASRIFLVGAGRSGLVGRFFAMRLMHLGKQVYMVGDTTTPSIQQHDLLIAVSGSGNTQSVVVMAEKARHMGAKVASVGLAKPGTSQLDKFSNLNIKLDRRLDPESRKMYEQGNVMEVMLNITPLGTVFEIAALVYFESLIGDWIRRDRIPEKDLRCRHANLE